MLRSDGLVNEWVDGWMDGWMNGWSIDGWVEELLSG